MQRGFTLIEMMIVVAIIGVLAALAIPRYQSYIATTQVTRVVSETSGQRSVVEDCILKGVTTTGPNGCVGTAQGSSLLADGGNMTSAGGAPPAGTGVPTLAFGVAGTATLTSVFGNSANAAIQTKAVVWARDASGNWSCSTDVLIGFASRNCPASP